MSRPELTFVCELDAPRLAALFEDGSVIEDIRRLRARVLLMLSDLRTERAAVASRLNHAGVPVVAVPLVAAEDGYYFTPENVVQARDSYRRFKQWTAEHGLVWDAVGLDIEPDAAVYWQIIRNRWGLVRLLAPRLLDVDRPYRAQAAYSELIDRIHADGWSVENYQMPLLADERRSGSTLLQRLLGLVDVRTDREVWMQYNSFMRGLGPGLLWSYGPKAPAIAVGTTGGGPDVPGHPAMPTLSWEEFARDLRLARTWTEHVYVHSLEGCVWQGFLKPLRSFDWTEVSSPPRRAWQADLLRRGLRGVLWGSAHPWLLGAGVVAAVVLRRSWQYSRASPRRFG